MSDEMRKRFAELPSKYLLEQYTRKRHEYTEQALGVLREELESRNISANSTPVERDSNETEKTAPTLLTPEDFVELEGAFSHVDLLLAQTVLRDLKIPFYAEGPPEQTVMPVEDQANQTWRIFAPKEQLDKAKSAVGEHFEDKDGTYSLKHQDTKTRLKAINFHEIQISEKEAEEEMDISFEPAESEELKKLARRLIDEADDIEAETGRVLFHYDGLEELIDSLENPTEIPHRRIDLMTILEVLQVYCDAKDYSENLDSVAMGILEFIGR